MKDGRMPWVHHLAAHTASDGRADFNAMDRFMLTEAGAMIISGQTRYAW
jgi:hypothetical protein